MRLAVLAAALIACTHAHHATTARAVPTPNVQVGACGDPARDGVISDRPRLEHADRDLDGDGQNELVVRDLAKCTSDGNCYWNVFAQPREAGECTRYLGTFEGKQLYRLDAKGDGNMSDVQVWWMQHDGRALLQTYHFVRGGYLLSEVLQCKRASDDRLECAEDRR